MRGRIYLLFGIILLLGSIAYGDGQAQNSGPKSERCFFYTAKKLGIPILKASIRIGNGTAEQGRSLSQIRVSVESLGSLGLFFRMKNRFASIIDAETCFPVRYLKTIDQGGLLFHRKQYTQTLSFDLSHQKVIVEGGGEEKHEISLPAETYDPLSVFARYYLKEELRPEEEIRVSLYDGIRFRQMVFHSKREKIRSQVYGEVESVCLESVTSFSTFGEKEGRIRIWYTMDGKKIPILMELELPVGNVRFELEEVKEG
ncbi:MAG: DUF3108 domain-containing protein [Syntrophaceae bacterium]|nr:DUF3108 domain-containing protein [Syntrophaceae bacterium]